MIKNIVSTCKFCEKEFSYSNQYNNRKYCSHQCYYNSKKIKPKKCIVCNKSYIPDKGYGLKWIKSKYCSNRCYLKNKVKSKWFFCYNCGTPTKKMRSQFIKNQNQFCSNKCLGISRKGIPRPEWVKEKLRGRISSMAGKKHTEETKQKISNAHKGVARKYPIWNKGNKLFSEIIKNKWKNGNYKKRVIPLRTERIKDKCQNCGADIEIKISKKKRYNFCSKKCYYIYRAIHLSKNMHSNSKKGIRIDLNNTFFRSKWEANYARVLNKQCIFWEYEQKMFHFKNCLDGVMSYTPDFYIPSLDQYIEIKGWLRQKDRTKFKQLMEQYPDEFSKLKVVIQNKKSKDYISLIEMGIKNIDFMAEITKQYKDSIDGWEI